MAYTRVMCASMHVLFPVRKFLLCAIAFASGKLRVVLKIADQSRAGSHFNSQNTHSQFRNSHFTRAHWNITSHLAFHPNTKIFGTCKLAFSLSFPDANSVYIPLLYFSKRSPILYKNFVYTHLTSTHEIRYSTFRRRIFIKPHVH